MIERKNLEAELKVLYTTMENQRHAESRYPLCVDMALDIMSGYGLDFNDDQDYQVFEFMYKAVCQEIEQTKRMYAEAHGFSNINHLKFST